MTHSKGVDITSKHLDEYKLLALLGEDDWLIALPESLPPLPVTKQFRDAMQAHAGRMFARWVMKGIDRSLTYDDPSRRRSAWVREERVDPLILLVKYETLTEWAVNSYTQHDELTYENEIEEFIEEQLSALCSEHLLTIWDVEDGEDAWSDPRWEEYDISLIPALLRHSLTVKILRLSTADAWEQFAAEIVAENEIARKKAEERHAMAETVRQFWERQLPDLTGQYIDMRLFHAMNLPQRITDVLADADPEIVRLMVIVGVPGDYSNSVRDRIQEFVRQAAL